MVENACLICDSGQIAESGKGLKFAVEHEGEEASAFVVRYNGQVQGYLNRCAHIPVELDWMEGEFFDDSGLYLVCSTHGAIYAPENGVCVGGPCSGKSLIKLPLVEHEGKIYLVESKDNYV